MYSYEAPQLHFRLLTMFGVQIKRNLTQISASPRPDVNLLEKHAYRRGEVHIFIGLNKRILKHEHCVEARYNFLIYAKKHTFTGVANGAPPPRPAL